MANNRENNKKNSRKSANGRQKAEQPEKITATKKETTRILCGVCLLVLGLCLFVACISYLFNGRLDQAVIQQGGLFATAENWVGAFGAHAANIIMNNGFGIASLFLILFMIVASLKCLGLGHIRLWKWFLNCSILMIWWSMATDYLLQGLFTRMQILDFMRVGGLHGEYTVNRVSQLVGSVGVFFVLLLTAVFYLAYVSSETIRYIQRMLNPINKYLDKRNAVSDETDNENIDNETSTHEAPIEESEAPITIDLSTPSDNNDTPAETEEFKLDVSSEPSATPDDIDEKETESVNFEISKVKEEEKSGAKTAEEVRDLEPYDPKKDLENYKYPKLDLLAPPTDKSIAIDLEEQNRNKDRIIKVLKDFGVEISTIKATIGPTITLYEIQPAPGVKISKIRNLEDDIALSLAALGIRIIAPIPGKGTIGIEVPNAKPQTVSMRSILESKRFKETDYELPCAIGKTITNEVYMVDLAKMPHLLVAGATGQGKSVGLNAIITSLLYKKHPAELKLVMVDPKKVEFSVYSSLVRHFLAQVEDEPEDDAIITDVTKVVATLKSLCSEMDSRYDLLKRVKARNIKEYNAKFKARQLNPDNGHRFLPYIVVIIDEFGDLIMTAGKKVEMPIARIAQLARAVGIHMIIATQRPTTNIITGTIKANFPARMAFKVAAMIDSRTILDRPGANQLIGRGDMLFLTGSEPVRVQCAFVDTPEVERVAMHIASQQGYTTSFQLPRVITDEGESESRDVDMKALDPMFDEVARMVVNTQSGSTSLIQRKFSLGYNRAGRLMDQLEAAGIVGPAQGSKPREVMIKDIVSLENLLTNIR